MKEIMYDIPSRGDIAKVVITKETIKNKKPELISKDGTVKLKEGNDDGTETA